MNFYGTSEEHQPVTWWRGHPIFAAHLIVVSFAASMIATAILMFAGWAGILGHLQFSSEAVWRGEVWRILTYGLVNQPSLWFAIDMLMIVWFGRELEKFFGRRKLLTLLGLWQPTSLSGQRGAFALFIAFATLHPGAVMLFNLLAKWVALVFVGLQSLIFLSSRDLVGLITLWATVGFAFAFVRHQQGHFSLPRFSLPGRKPRLRVLADLPAKKRAEVDPGPDHTMAEVDALLDKIATSGIASLTSKERAKLDAARKDLLKKTPGRQ
jgi:hypothetical protein